MYRRISRKLNINHSKFKKHLQTKFLLRLEMAYILVENFFYTKYNFNYFLNVVRLVCSICLRVVKIFILKLRGADRSSLSPYEKVNVQESFP